MARPSKLTPEQKNKIIFDAGCGRPVSAIAKEYGVTVQYVYKLLAAAPAKPCWNCEDGFESAQREEKAYFCSDACRKAYNEESKQLSEDIKNYGIEKDEDNLDLI